MSQLRVRVTPKAGTDEVAGLRDGELQVRVRSAPEGGKANAAACRVVAGFLGVPKSHVRVVRGDTSRHKTLEIDGLDELELTKRVGEAGELP